MSLSNILFFFGLVIAPSLLSAQTDYSIHFDGDDDRIIVGDSAEFEIDDQATIEFWMNVEEFGNDLMLLVSKEGEYNIGLSKEGRISWAFANTIPGWNWFYSSTTLPLNTWVHVAVRFDLDFIAIFLNGQQITNTPSSGMVGDVDPDHNLLIIGDRQQDMFNLPFKGKLDEFRLWDIARSDIQIMDKMATKLQGDESGLKVYYRFDEMDRPCDVVSCTADEFHGQRMGESGPNMLPQYDPDVPSLEDVPLAIVNGCLISSLDPVMQVMNWQVQPNPASDMLRITWDERQNIGHSNSRFLISDAHGRLVMEWPATGPVVEVPLSTLVNGMYTIRLADSPGSLATRFIVQH